jgi:uncharacterized membrane protein YtjA (UPF0391 family)
VSAARVLELKLKVDGISRSLHGDHGQPSHRGEFIQRGVVMLRYALIFLVIALIAGILGFTGLAGAAVGIARILFVVFVVLFVASLIFGRRRS